MQSHFSLFLSTLKLGFPAFIGHTLITLALLFILSEVYVKITHQYFLKAVKNNHSASAVSYGAVYISFAIPLAACLAGSVNAMDILIWALPLGIAQFICFLGFDLVFTNLRSRVANDEIAVAILVGMVRISVGIIWAGAIID